MCSKCRFSPPQPDLRSFLFHILSQLLLQLHCNLPYLPLGEKPDPNQLVTAILGLGGETYK